MELSEIRRRLTLYPPQTEEVAREMDELREAIIQLGEMLEEALPVGRERMLALTNLEQVCFWSIGAIARNQ
jgi:hypothetical protein